MSSADGPSVGIVSAGTCWADSRLQVTVSKKYSSKVYRPARTADAGLGGLNYGVISILALSTVEPVVFVCPIL